MNISRRTFTQAAVVCGLTPSVPSTSKDNDPILSCFAWDEVEANSAFRFEYDSIRNAPQITLLGSRATFTKKHEALVVVWNRDCNYDLIDRDRDGFRSPGRYTLTDSIEALKQGAREQLSFTAGVGGGTRNPKQWFADRGRTLNRVVELDGETIAVAQPHEVGNIVDFVGGGYGLGCLVDGSVLVV